MDFKKIFESIIEKTKEEPIIVLGVIMGVLFATWLSGIISWIPLLGSLVTFMLQFIFAFLGGFIAYKLKSEYLK